MHTLTPLQGSVEAFVNQLLSWPQVLGLLVLVLAIWTVYQRTRSSADPSGSFARATDTGAVSVTISGAYWVGLLVAAVAALTWPLPAAVALFGGGAVVAFVAEAVVINLGFLEHHVGPKLLGVPLYVLFGWTGVIYLAFRGSLLVTEGCPAVLTAAVLATSYDLLTDHRGVEDGYWTYTDDLPGPSVRAVPWWNFAGWLCISASTAALSLPFL
jgi:hypothetical protein